VEKSNIVYLSYYFDAASLGVVSKNIERTISRSGSGLN
jgi:hypothetical protein